MNTITTRAIGIALVVGIAWTFGYYVGANKSRKEIRDSGGSAHARDGASSKSSPHSTALGSVIDGKTNFGRQISLHQYAESLDTAAMSGAVHEAMQLPLLYRNEALAVLFSRWAELDPAAAAEYARLLPKSTNPDLFVGAAVTAWAEKDFAGALTWVQSLKNGAAKIDALRCLANALAETDPAGALKLIKENVPARDRDVVYENVFMTLAAQDFAGALAAAEGITDLRSRSRALRAALIARADKEPREVLEYLRTSKLAELRSDAGNPALSRWLERDLAAARDYVLSQPAGEMRTMQIGHVSLEMARHEPREALAWIEEVPESDREQAAQSLFWVWGNNDPKAAIDAVRGLSDGSLREKSSLALVLALAGNDRAAAIDLLEDLPAGAARDSTVNQIATHWAGEDPAKAVEWYMKYTGDNQRDGNGLPRIVAEWSNKDPEGAFKWASALPEGPQKGVVLARTMLQLMLNDPASATAKLEKLPAESLRSAVGDFVSHWGYRDPKAAAEWVLTLSDEIAKSKAIGGLASQWGSQDPSAATRWIEKLPAGTDRDAAVANFAVAAAKADPEGAVAWATTIQNADESRNTIRRVFTTWLSKDPAAAGNWLQSAKNVSAEMRTELMGIQASFPRK